MGIIQNQQQYHFGSCSTERIETELGFKPDYTFEQGMKETIEWYENL